MEVLISYGSISKDFKIFAELRKFLVKVKSGEIKEHRLDCYPTDPLSNNIIVQIANKVADSNLGDPTNIELFYPSNDYPPHVDGEGRSCFVALERGQFYIDGVTYDVVPFVLYGFDHSLPHNTNFPSLMIAYEK